MLFLNVVFPSKVIKVSLLSNLPLVTVTDISVSGSPASL